MKFKKYLSLLALAPIVAVLTGCPKPASDPDAILDSNQRLFSEQEEKVTLRDVTHLGEGPKSPHK